MDLKQKYSTKVQLVLNLHIKTNEGTEPFGPFPSPPVFVERT